jgi:hypothetical protein
MANITIDRGESVSLGFEINGIVIADLLDLQIYVGEWVFKLSDATITQDVFNIRLFFVKLNSTLTNRCVGTMPISLAVVTDLLGVNKESNIANLIVKETNQRTVLNDLSEYIAGTFVVTIDLAQVTTNVILENIYRVESVNAVDSVNGQTGVVVLDADDIAESATRLFLTPTQSSNITTNNGKVGITPTQASNIVNNNGKVGYTEALVSANSSVSANTAKVGITTGQASAITTNTAKVGITTTQASNIVTNNAKVGITPAQATAISQNTLLKVNKSRTIYQGFTTVTGVTVPTIAFSVLIPANTYDAVDGFSLTVCILSRNTSGSVFYNLFHDTALNGISNVITTAIGLSSSPRGVAYQRILNLSGGNSYNNVPFNINTLTPYSSSSASNTITPFDPAVNNYITLQVSGHTVVEDTSSLTLSIQPLKG